MANPTDQFRFRNPFGTKDIAYFEAGRTAVALHLGMTVESVTTTRPLSKWGLRVTLSGGTGTPGSREDGAVVALAGPLTLGLRAKQKRRLLDREWVEENGMLNDFPDDAIVTPLLPQELLAYKLYLYFRAYRHLTDPTVWRGVEVLAESLLKNSTLTGQEAKSVWDSREQAAGLEWVDEFMSGMRTVKRPSKK